MAKTKKPTKNRNRPVQAATPANPAPSQWALTRHHFFKVLGTLGITAFGTWIGNVFTPRERRIWDLIPRPVPQPLVIAVSETINVSSHAVMTTFGATVSHRFIPG